MPLTSGAGPDRVWECPPMIRSTPHSGFSILASSMSDSKPMWLMHDGQVDVVVL